MLADDTVANTQSQSSPFTYLFGREEGIKDAFRVFDPVAIIAEDDLYPRSVVQRLEHDAAWPSGNANGIVGIIENVQKNLLQLV